MFQCENLALNRDPHAAHICPIHGQSFTRWMVLVEKYLLLSPLF